MRTESAYPKGIDCVWIASDRHGNSAAFVTGGEGPIPSVVLELDRTYIMDSEAAICALPISSDVELLVSMNRPDDFIAMAERGFFVYDWQDVHRSASEASNLYELIASPINPARVASFAGFLSKALGRIVFEDIVISNERAVDVRAAYDSIDGDASNGAGD
jgi:hypothetical protein